MSLPDFSFEKSISKKGYRVIAGVDEVGRGSFAGPVVAAVVAFAQGREFENLNVGNSQNKIVVNDSKKMTPKQRERSAFWIKRESLCYGIGWASVAQINKLGIKKASEIAFRHAIKNCNRRIDYLLIDAFYIPYIKGLRRKNQKPIVKGDTRSVSIAAASVIAKVYRDKLMNSLGNRPKYKKYAWDKNKGYGTLGHRKAIIKYGTSRLHRKIFVETFLSRLPLH